MKGATINSKNLLLTTFKKLTSIILFVIILFSIGVIFGAIIVNSLSHLQKNGLLTYLNDFFAIVMTEEGQPSRDLFLQSFFHNLKLIVLIMLFGLSVLGLPLALICLFLKGTVVGFTVGFLVNQLSFKGFLLVLAAILPQNLIIVPVFLMSTSLAIIIAFKIIEKLFIKPSARISRFFKMYFMAFFFFCLLLLIGAAIEAFIAPGLMKFAMANLKI